MKSLLCVEHGPPEKLVIREIDAPAPGTGEIRIIMHAAGLNFPDGLIIQNLYQFKPTLPFTPGGEAAGVIEALGEGCGELAVGDRVAVMTRWGAFAERVVAPASSAVKLPLDMPYDEGAAFGMTYGTAYHALVQRADLKSGETLLVLGAAGGVGLAAIEIGKALGARVIAAASSAEKLLLAREHGADETIDYSTADLKAATKALTGGQGVDVVLDPVGDRFAEPALRSIKWGGRYLVVGFAAGAIPHPPLNLVLLKSAAIIGVFWGAWADREPANNQSNMRSLLDLYSKGRIRPHVSKSYPLAEGAAAIRWLLDRKALGKIVLTAG
jgi:NADPH2:quinone reductase